jgi:hypothetical protein
VLCTPIAVICGYGCPDGCTNLGSDTDRPVRRFGFSNPVQTQLMEWADERSINPSTDGPKRREVVDHHAVHSEVVLAGGVEVVEGFGLRVCCDVDNIHWTIWLNQGVQTQQRLNRVTVRPFLVI